MRRALARRSASMMISSSIRLSLAGAAGGLDQEHVLAADIFAHLDEDFVVGKAADIRLDRGQPQIGADVGDQRLVGIAGNEAHAPRSVQIRHRTPATP